MHQMDNKLSIITAVYNGRRFVEFCIKNVIQQNCHDLEHIIVDGGSSDGSLEIIKQYSKEFPHIRWVSEKDKGQSDAMNKGVAMAEGNILGFLNVDDFYEPNVINRVLDIFRSLREPALLVGNCNILDENENIVEINKPRKLDITDLMLGWNINPYPTNPSQYFYHKSLHEVIGLYDLEEHYALDIDFLSRAVQVAHVKYIDEVWGNYRKIAGTKTVNDITSGQCDDRFKAVLQKYKKQLNIMQLLQIAIKFQLYKIKQSLTR
jgi:glycosyltransferase involved in cell wall biosynthesis